MSAKQIEVTCPCCSSKLLVDTLTARVMRTEAPAAGAEGGGDKWSSAQDRVRGRTASGLDKLDKALESERGKSDRLDDLFRKAKEKLTRPDEDD